MTGVARAVQVSIVCTVLLSGTPVAARSLLGCFARTYDAAHLHLHLDQQVQRLWLRVEKSRYDSGKIDFGMNLWIRGRQQIWRAGGRCEQSAEGLSCQPDTDGASGLLLSLEGRNLRLTNLGKLKIFDDETGPDLNEKLIDGPGDATFLLRPARGAVCNTSR